MNNYMKILIQKNQIPLRKILQKLLQTNLFLQLYIEEKKR